MIKATPPLERFYPEPDYPPHYITQYTIAENEDFREYCEMFENHDRSIPLHREDFECYCEYAAEHAEDPLGILIGDRLPGDEDYGEAVAARIVADRWLDWGYQQVHEVMKEQSFSNPKH